MKRCTDEEILKRAEVGVKRSRSIQGLAEFRRQFSEYRRRKEGDRGNPRNVCRPYVEIFQQTPKGDKC